MDIKSQNNQKPAASAAPVAKSAHAEREERILAYWNEKGIFDKTLAKPSPKGEFIFYEGPPTANGRPGIHHLEARAFKDAIPRYKTMRGYRVRRKGGWDTHGLPVELQVEKELGLKSKKEIEQYGVGAFNEKCKQSVWTYVREWEEFTRRMGYWVDLKDPYITYKPRYIESLWNIVKHVDSRKLLYKDYKVLPWCPRCGTALSSHELAQGYQDVKDLSVYVKFAIKGKPGVFILAWTTTPWTLPGNVALAVGADIIYVQIEITKSSAHEGEGVADLATYYLAKDRLSVLGKDPNMQYRIVRELKGSELVGLEYEPLYPFLRDNVTAHEKPKLANAFKVYAADFVTTADGTGVVHIAPMYGQDDFELGTKNNLPKHHLIHDDGTFKKEAGFLAGTFVKDEGTEVAVIKDLAARGQLFAKEKYQHTYPFCWRCKTPLIYFARDSWYIRMSELRDDLVKENGDIRWEPGYIKEGRFGEWLREIKDWAISRERYWGTPLPVWVCHACHERKVIGSVEEIAREPKNRYFVMRHGEAEDNVKNILNSDSRVQNHLTENGKERAHHTATRLQKEGIDLIITSPFERTQETAKIVHETLGLGADAFLTDDRIRELGLGTMDGSSLEDFMKVFPMDVSRFENSSHGVETYAALKKRMGDFLYDIESKHSGKTILIVTHGSPAMMLMAAAHGWNREESIAYEKAHYIHKAEARPLHFRIVPHNSEYELDLHKPFIDEVKLPCERPACKEGGVQMHRVKEVMDVWFDSGSMPFAQDHYPFEGRERGGLLGIFGKSKQELAYPADFISEAIDQTRGWFYTLHAVGTLMGKGKAFRNVICLGHILDGEGKKMSKSLGNIVNPWDMMNKYGADALRFWMYSVNQPGESKNFEEKTVDEVVKKVFNLAANVTSFYKMYATADVRASADSANALDRWIVSRLNETLANVTANLDKYVFLEPTRNVRDFIADLSQWYLRRSRDRFKEEGGDKQAALQTTKHVLLTLAKMMAPFTPFFAEELYREIGGSLESVHLEEWPTAGPIDSRVITDMVIVRTVSSKALEARMKSGINVRQPLGKLTIYSSDVKIQSALAQAEMKQMIMEELNVKDVVCAVGKEEKFELDTNITPELKEEGDLRELLRKIQDMRKEKGLTVKDSAVLVATDAERAIVQKYADEIKKATRLSAIEYGNMLSLR